MKLFTTVLFVSFLTLFNAPELAAQRGGGSSGGETAGGITIKDLIKTLAKETKAGDEDADAIKTITTLQSRYAKAEAKDQKAIVTGIEKCLSAKRKTPKDTEPDVPLHTASVEALGTMMPASLKALTKLIKSKQHEDNETLIALAIEQLGNSSDESAIKPLTELLTANSINTQSAAVTALGSFSSHPGKVRKEIFEDLLKTTLGIMSAQSAKADDTEIQERVTRVMQPGMKSMEQLTGHSETMPDAWQTWWNENKRADWDEEFPVK